MLTGPVSILRSSAAQDDGRVGHEVMGALVFSQYYLTGNEGADFQIGARPVLDEYDGFFDQARDAVKPGDRLLFLLNDGCLVNRHGLFLDCPGVRAR